MATRVDLAQFGPQELTQLRQGFQNEINTLNQSMQQFRFAIEKFEEGKRSIKAAEDLKSNEEMLLPLSNALYIEGVLDNLNSKEEKVYLIEYGAGFFVERKAQEAIDFYSRKVALIKEKSTQLQTIISEKREGLKAIEARMMQIAQAQAQAQQNAAMKK